VADESQSLSIGEFEHVAVGPSMVLLRVNGRSSRPRASPDWRPTLVADHGSGLKRFDALPSPPDADGVLRAAYSVPADLVVSGTRFWLEIDDGQTVDLPDPTPGAARRPTPQEEPADVEPDQVATLTAELATARERATQLEGENQTMSATLEELEIWRGELERRLADTTTELAETRARLAEAHAAAELEALVARAEADALEQAARELAEATEQARSRD
jgi:hypothetical protein